MIFANNHLEKLKQNGFATARRPKKDDHFFAPKILVHKYASISTKCFLFYHFYRPSEGRYQCFFDEFTKVRSIGPLRL